MRKYDSVTIEMLAPSNPAEFLFSRFTFMDDLDPTRWPTYAGGLAALLILAAWSFSRPKRNLPPGPKGLPILGNVFQLPPFPWLKFTEWKDQYGG